MYLTGFISENKTNQNFAAEIGMHLVFCYKVLVSYWRIHSPMSWCIVCPGILCVSLHAVTLKEKKSL